MELHEFRQMAEEFYGQLEQDEQLRGEFAYFAIRQIAKITGRTNKEVASNFGRSTGYFSSTHLNWKNGSRRSLNTLTESAGKLIDEVVGLDGVKRHRLKSQLFADYKGIKLPHQLDDTYHLDINPKPTNTRASRVIKKKEDKKSDNIESTTNDKSLKVTNQLNRKEFIIEGVPQEFVEFYHFIHQVMEIETVLTFEEEEEPKVIQWKRQEG